MSLASLIAQRMLAKKKPAEASGTRKVARAVGSLGIPKWVSVCSECGCETTVGRGHYPGCSKYVTRAAKKEQPAPLKLNAKAFLAACEAPPISKVGPAPELTPTLSAPLKPVSNETRWSKQCEAINADDGRRCGLLQGHDLVDAAADEAAVMACSPVNRDIKRFELAQRRWHRSARGPFTRCAQPGQTFPERERLDQLAEARGAPHDDYGKASLGKGDSRPKGPKAHRGIPTTTGLERPITQESV